MCLCPRNLNSPTFPLGFQHHELPSSSLFVFSLLSHHMHHNQSHINNSGNVSNSNPLIHQHFHRNCHPSCPRPIRKHLHRRHNQHHTILHNKTLSYRLRNLANHISHTHHFFSWYNLPQPRNIHCRNNGHSPHFRLHP